MEILDSRFGHLHEMKPQTLQTIGLLLLSFLSYSCVASRLNVNGTTFTVNGMVDLKGHTITLPKDGVLVFNGKGCLKNGTLIGNNTRIEGSGKGYFEKVKIKGDWNVAEIRSSFFKDARRIDVLKDLFSLCSELIENTILLEKGDYWVTASKDIKYALSIPSHTKLQNNGTIRICPNNLISYAIVAICGDDIVIDGGNYVGEREQHQGNTGEWGHGIRVTDGSSNVVVKNVRVADCWGDGIAVEGNEVNSHVLIEDFEIFNCRRQGISVIFAKDCFIRNGEISQIHGTEPHLGIDIEPNSNGYCEDVTVENVRIDSEKGIGVFTALKEYQTRNVTIKNCKVNTTGYAPFWASRCDGLVLQDNEFTTTVSGKQHVIVINSGVRNCTIERNNLKHLAMDNSHYCVFSSGDNVRIVNNVLTSGTGVGFYTDHAVIEENVVNVPQLMTGASNANDNIFRCNTIVGGISCNATGNQFISNEVKGEVKVKAQNCIVRNNIRIK